MSRNPLQTCPFDGTRDTPGAETRPAGKPVGDSADKMTRETCPGKSSNGKEKRPRSRREKVSAPGFFRPSPEIKIPSPEKRIPGLGISRSGPEISRQTVQKVNCSDKILHRSPVLCKKIAQKSAIWAGLRKSRVTKISQNGTICLFSQVFHDILIMSPPPLICCDGFVCLCGREPPPSLRATSPTRRRSLFCYTLYDAFCLRRSGERMYFLDC